MMIKLYISHSKCGTGIYGEKVWATPLKNGNYRLENQPLLVGLKYGDIVKAEEIEGILTLKAVVIRGVVSDDENHSPAPEIKL